MSFGVRFSSVALMSSISWRVISLPSLNKRKWSVLLFTFSQALSQVSQLIASLVVRISIVSPVASLVSRVRRLLAVRSHVLLLVVVPRLVLRLRVHLRLRLHLRLLLLHVLHLRVALRGYRRRRNRHCIATARRPSDSSNAARESSRDSAGGRNAIRVGCTRSGKVESVLGAQ